MAREKDPELRAWLVNETANAICVAPLKGGAQSHQWWIPRSQIGYLRKEKTAGGSVHVVFTAPEWLIEQKQCWELVP